MAELILEPYAAYLHWTLPAGGKDQPWGCILAGYLEALAARCEADGRGLIGHIKGLATFDNGDYLRVNVVSSSHPADVAGVIPENCTELTLTLNVLVYGLTDEYLSGCVEETAALTAKEWGGSVQVEPIGAAPHESHHHH